jgi:hypothetical protein
MLEKLKKTKTSKVFGFTGNLEITGNRDHN